MNAAARYAATVATVAVTLSVLACGESPTATPEVASTANADLVSTESALRVTGPERLVGHQTPLAINQRGWVLTRLALHDRTSVTQLAPDFWSNGMNQSTVVGYVSPEECPTAASLDPKSGEITHLPTPDGYDAATAVSIDAGQVIVGWAGVRNQASRCEIRHQDVVVWNDGEPLVLQPLHDGVPHRPHAINRRGDVAGIAGVEAALWRDGRPVGLGRFGGRLSRALGLNDRGQVVGFSDTDEKAGVLDITKAFLWQDGTMTPLESLGGHTSFARDINNDGLIVGSSLTTEPTEHAVAWYRGTITDLGTLGGARSAAHAVNERGDVVGWAEDAAGTRHMVIWRVRP